MGEQIEKLSSLLERTVEQIELKMDKLDHNFTFIYEKMSNIEYDNASFKDKLSSFMNIRPIERKASPSKKTQGDGLLNILGQFSSANSALS